MASCVALGVAVVGVRSAAAAAAKEVQAGENGDAKDGMKLDLGIKVEIPEMGKGKRYSECWIVGQVVKVEKA